MQLDFGEADEKLNYHGYKIRACAHMHAHVHRHNYQKAAFPYLRNAVISSATQQASVFIENCNLNQKLNLKKKFKIQKG